MKRLFSKRFSMLAAALILTSSVTFSQTTSSPFERMDFLRTAPEDAVKFVQAYITPWANAFGAGLNGSWYNTAKPHKWGGFDVTLGVNVGIVPSSAETFDISSLGLSSSLTGSGSAATVAGSKNLTVPMTYSESGVQLASFNTPPGTGWKYIPVPTLQVGIGLPLGTELKGRFVPRISISGGDVMLWGVGLMHSITQYLPGEKILPIDVAIFGGYTWLNGNIPLDLQPDASITPHYTTYNPAVDFADQNLSATVTALNAGVIGSVNLKFITFYAGLGYSNTRTVVELTGNYPTPVVVTPGTGLPYADYNDDGVMTGEDFPKIDIPNFSGLRTNVGIRFKITVITIHVDYTRSQYNVVSAGLGVSFR